MEWLCALALGLLALAAIGHVIWLAGAAILRGLFGHSQADAPFPITRPFTQCPACRAAVDPRDRECGLCGMLLDTRSARQLTRVRAAEAEVRALAEAGDLDAGTARTVSEQLERRARILQGLPADSPRPAGAAEREMETIPRVLPVPVSEPKSEPIVLPSFPKRDAEVPASAAEPDSSSVAAASPEHTTPPPAPHRGSVLAGFMEERNILWGELVGGLLIVGCSIALVVTLWHRLEAIPYFPFLLSAAVTLALYGAGQYTLHHWKLESTSRGLLVIALLLAPLNLLLLSDPIMRSEVALPLDVGVKFGAVALFAWVVRGGGRDVLTARPGWRWPLALAVVGAPASQLLPAAWFADAFPHLPAWFALGCFVGAVAIALRGTVRGEDAPFDRAAGAALLQFVGLAAFGLGAAWGLHIARAPDVADGVRGLALPLTLAAVPIIEAGLLVQRRVLGGGLRVTGTGVALAGFGAITGGLVVAWPDPLSVLLVSLAAGLFLTRVAFRESLSWAHVGAIPGARARGCGELSRNRRTMDGTAGQLARLRGHRGRSVGLRARPHRCG